VVQKEKAPRKVRLQWTTFAINSLQMQGLVEYLFQLSFVRNREFVTAFRPAARQYFAAISCLHTLAKTMYRFATAIMRLKCTFHNNFIFLSL